MEATTGWTEGKPWEIACGELRGEEARWKRRGGQRGIPWEMDGRETVGNSMGRALYTLGRSNTEGTRGWTERKPWEIAWGWMLGDLGDSSVGKERDGSAERVDRKETVGNSLKLGESSVKKERDGSDDRVDGGETVGNSMRRAPWQRKGMEATTGWTERRPWEIAWGELRGKGRYGNDERVDRKETVGNSSGRAPWGRSDMEATTGWTEGKLWEIAWGELRWEGARWKR